LQQLQEMNGKSYSLAMSALNTFSVSPTLKTMWYEAHRKARFRHRTQLKEAPNEWFVVAILASLHFIPQGQTVTAEYYITKILEEEVKPLFF